LGALAEESGHVEIQRRRAPARPGRLWPPV
jgi:hypothetical protein